MLNLIICVIHRHEAIELHIKGLREDKLSIPASSSFAEYVAVK